MDWRGAWPTYRLLGNWGVRAASRNYADSVELSNITADKMRRANHPRRNHRIALIATVRADAGEARQGNQPDGALATVFPSRLRFGGSMRYRFWQIGQLRAQCF